MTEEFDEMMRKTAGNVNAGYLSALFDTAIESIAKIAVDERMPGAIHKAVNPALDDMIGQLHSMKNNTMATIMFANDEKMKVVQSTRADIIRSLHCDNCANENTDSTYELAFREMLGHQICDEDCLKFRDDLGVYRCEDCANENTDICDRCQGLDEPGSKPGNWKPKDTPMDCDEGRICPRCGKVMILREDRRTYYWVWECDGCGYKEVDE